MTLSCSPVAGRILKTKPLDSKPNRMSLAEAEQLQPEHAQKDLPSRTSWDTLQERPLLFIIIRMDTNALNTTVLKHHEHTVLSISSSWSFHAMVEAS